MIEPIKYEPTEQDLIHVGEIRDFLNSEEIPFKEDKDVFGLFYVNNRTTQLRYVWIHSTIQWIMQNDFSL